MRKYPECVPALIRAGISEDDAFAIRRVAMTLQRWHERECGDGNGMIERPFADEKPYWTYYTSTGGSRSYRIPDSENGALRRLKSIMARYPDYVAYQQGDPRGASLWLVRKDRVPPGRSVDEFYTSGIAVYK